MTSPALPMPPEGPHAVLCRVKIVGDRFEIIYPGLPDK